MIGIGKKYFWGAILLGCLAIHDCAVTQNQPKSSSKKVTTTNKVHRSK